MKISTKQLKAFNSAAGSMRQNGILPILSFLKLDNGTITKNNLEAFITMDIDFEGSYLIDEKILMGFVESVDAEEIDIEVKGTTIVLSHGKEKMVSPTDDVANYPAVSEPEGEALAFTPDILKSIKVASNFTMDRENLPFASCVFVGNGIVGASSGFVAYIDKADEGLPNIILEKAAISALKGMEFVMFQQNETYTFFSTGSFRYGFIKKDTKFVDMARFGVIPDEKAYPADKNEILRFCDAINNICTGRVVISKIAEGKLSMIDADYGINYEKPLSSEVPDFSFNPSMMARLLKSLPDEQIKIIKSTNKFYISGEGSYVSLIMELA